MAFIPTPQGVKFEINYVCNGVELANVGWVDLNTAVTPTLVGQVASVVGGWVQGVLLDHLSSDLDVINVIATDGSVAEGSQAIIDSGFPASGTVVSPAMPNNVAAVASLRTGLTGRSARGRMYIPGLGESTVTGNLVNETQVTNLISDLEALRDAINTEISGAFWSVNSFYTAGAARTNGRMLPIETITMRQKVGTMRKRLD